MKKPKRIFRSGRPMARCMRFSARMVFRFAEKIACGWRTAHYIANDLRYRKCQFSRRTRERIFFAAGILSLALWLFMATAEICTPLHAWLHGGTIPADDDDCAIVAIAHGKIEAAPCAAPVVVPVTWIEIAERAEISVFVPADKNLLPGRGPPALPTIS
jgi:hypothetical protein